MSALEAGLVLWDSLLGRLLQFHLTSGPFLCLEPTSEAHFLWVTQAATGFTTFL